MKVSFITGDNNGSLSGYLGVWRSVFHEEYERNYVAIINDLFNYYDILVSYSEQKNNLKDVSHINKEVDAANKSLQSVMVVCRRDNLDEILCYEGSLSDFSRDVDQLFSFLEKYPGLANDFNAEQEKRALISSLKQQLGDLDIKITSALEMLRPCIKRIEIRSGHFRTMAEVLNLDTNSIEIRDRSIIHWATDSNFDSDDFLLNQFGLELFQAYTEMKVTSFYFVGSILERLRNAFLDDTILDADVLVSLGNDLKLIELAFGTVTSLFEKHMSMSQMDTSLDNKNSAVDNSNFVNTKFLFLLCSFFRTYFSGGKIRLGNLSSRFTEFYPSYSGYFGGESNELSDIDFLEQDPYLQEEHGDILEIYRCLKNAVSRNSLEEVKGISKK